jgi:hypothetical protein
MPWPHTHAREGRMMLGQALTDTWLTKGHLTQARPEAERFLELTMAAAERTS